MDALRTALAHLSSQPAGRAADTADALAALGAAPVFVAAWHRRRAGQPPIAGGSAHVLEQRRTGRLTRPASH